MPTSIESIIPSAAQIDAQNLILSRIAEKLGAYEEPLSWAALQAQVRSGAIGLFIHPGEQLEVGLNCTLSVSVSGEGITAASVDKDTFLDAAGTGHSNYEFSFDGNWHYDGSVVSLLDYGITVTGTAASGDLIVIHKSVTIYDFDVLGIDEDEPANANLDHVLSIQMHPILSLLNFDPPQYLFPVTAESLSALGISGDVLPAGTYKVTLDHAAYDGGTGEDGTYRFTTTMPIPIGGGIRHSTMGASQSSYKASNITGGVFVTYGADSVTVLENNLACTSGSTGTSLGTTTCNDPSYKAGNFINFTQRQQYGSGRWSTSYIRQYLNSVDAELNWKPGTVFSRNCSPIPEGFLHAIDPDLKSVLCKVRTRYALSASDGYGYEDVEDFVKLPTLLDIFGDQNNSITEGPVDSSGNVKRSTAYALWAERSTNADRIKYQEATARIWWLASPHTAYGNQARSVSASGATNSNGAFYTNGVVPNLFIG